MRIYVFFNLNTHLILAATVLTSSLFLFKTALNTMSVDSVNVIAHITHTDYYRPRGEWYRMDRVLKGPLSFEIVN